MADLKSTPLRAAHEALGARMVPFAGWCMPVQYAGGILAEHRHTRTAASLFDCSHMGQFRLRGPRVGADLDALLPRRASDQRVGSCRYNFFLAADGGVIDDLLVYRLAADEFYLVVNAATVAGDAEHVRGWVSGETAFVDESAATAKLDLQGPATPAVLRRCGVAPEDLPAYYHWRRLTVAGIPVLLSRTGYTGEWGVELYSAAAAAPDLWQALVAADPVAPAGLGARDTLRLEMGYPLYGHELNRGTTPREAGFGGRIDTHRNFLGAAALRTRPVAKTLTGLRFAGRRAARNGAVVYQRDVPVGTVTSGSFAPSLGCAVALAYVHPAPTLGARLQADCGRTRAEAEVVVRPFYRRGSRGN